MTPDATILSGHVRRFAEFEEIVLSREALPTLAQNPWRIDSARRNAARRGCARAIRNRESVTVRIVAIHSAGYPQINRQRSRFNCIRLVCGQGRRRPAWRVASGYIGRPAITGAIGGATSVVNHVGTCVLVTSHVGLNDVPTEQRKFLVKGGITVQVGVVAIGE